MINLFSSPGSCLVALAILIVTSTSAPALEESERLATFVDSGMTLWQVPGMAVSVVSSDEVLFQRGFGTTALDDGVKVDEHTQFAIASTTKAMVVTGLLMLVDEGKLSLDDPIVKHIPELHFSDPLLTEQLMVRDLLAHRTGLPSTDFWTFFQDMPLDEQIRRLESVPVAAPLRTRLIYQNTMFELAGLMIERLSEMRWDDFLKERLWLPIGMTETFGARGQIGSKLTHVTPYYILDEQITLAEWDFPADLTDAAGSVWSSIHDMSLWAQFLLRDGVTKDGKRLVSEASFEEMFEPQQLASPDDFYPTVELTQPNWRSYGLAWFQQDFQGRKIDFHTGSLSGLIAIIGLDRAGDKAVVVLGNRDHAEMRHAVLWEVMDASAPNERRNWNQEIFDLYQSSADQGDEKWTEMERQRLRKTKSSLSRDDYTGGYESKVIGEITVALEGRNLLLKSKKVDLPMTHWHLDTFLVEYKPWGLREFAEFHVGPDGTIEELELFGESFYPAGNSE
jgi:CubicO group peptidase (beta-lactamase class C family)